MGLLDSIRIADQTDEEFVEQLAPDPAPDERPSTRKKAPAKPGPAPVAAARRKTPERMAKEVAEDLATMIEMTAAVWSVRDQCCAPVLSAQAKPIAEAFTAILARNPRMLARFANADSALLIVQGLALGKALLPVGQAIYRNHSGAKAGQYEQEGPDGPPVVDLDAFPSFSGVGRAERP